MITEVTSKSSQRASERDAMLEVLSPRSNNLMNYNWINTDQQMLSPGSGQVVDMGCDQETQLYEVSNISPQLTIRQSVESVPNSEKKQDAIFSAMDNKSPNPRGRRPIIYEP